MTRANEKSPYAGGTVIDNDADCSEDETFQVIKKQKQILNY
jgi:hypothetical protein